MDRGALDIFPFLTEGQLEKHSFRMSQEYLNKMARRLPATRQKLEAALAAKLIRNVELVDMKDDIGRLMEATWFANSMGDRDEPYVSSPNIATVLTLAKRFAKKPKTTMVQHILAFAAFWEPYAALVRDLKPYVQKGRAPKEEPVDPRTLENTGTCAICSRNIKLGDGKTGKIGKMVDHGFFLANSRASKGVRESWGYGRTGGCFGVAFPPIEISPAALVALKPILERRLEAAPDALVRGKARVLELQKALKALKEAPETAERQAQLKDTQGRLGIAQQAVAQHEIDLQFLPGKIQEIGRRIETWAPQPLPYDAFLQKAAEAAQKA